MLASFLATLLLATSPASAAQAQTPEAERIDPLVERFMVLVEMDSPPSDALTDPWVGEELLRLNPGRHDEVGQVLQANERCSAIIIAAMPRAARNAARAMGKERLTRLVAYLESPAGEAMARARRADDGGRPDSEGAAPSMPDVVRNDYARWMYAIPTHVDAADTARIERCFADLEELAARLGVEMP